MKKTTIILVVIITVVFTLNSTAQSDNEKNHKFTQADLLGLHNVIDLLKAAGSPLDYSKYSFQSFLLSVNLSGVEYTETASDSVFTDRQKRLISKSLIGSKLYVEKIRVIEQGETDGFYLPRLIIKLKE
jgi:hypothetical protein